jgi:hypothetical protein
MSRPQTAAAAAVLILLVLCGFRFFPGHTFLQADTQIYIPILERLRDPTLYPHDPVALRPHVTYTVYDEVALLLSGAGFQTTLVAQQLLFRLCGLTGVFLIGRAFSLSVPMALLLASVYGLGAWIGGPSVLILEYEPVPRGFAGPLLILALGLAMQQRWFWAASAASIAMLYHPPTTLPFLAVFALVTISRRDWKAFLPILAAGALLLIVSRMQPGHTEPQQFWGVIDADLEKLQRLRGSYNWISAWPAHWIRHYEFLTVLLVLAWVRLRRANGRASNILFWGLPIYGLLMIPISLLSLEGLKWTLLTQFQPARALLFVVLATMLAATLCAIDAARQHRTIESIAWGLAAFAIPAQADVLTLLFPDWRVAPVRSRFLVVLALSGLLHVAARWETDRPAVSRPAWLGALLLPFWLLPGPGTVVNYRDVDHPEIHQLAGWARGNTAKDAVFVFPDSGQELYPGLFRAYSLRSVYVDWKAGGQVNLLRDFAADWWQRWLKAGAGKLDPARWQDLPSLGVDYAVLKRENRRPAGDTAYENSRYVVYRLR